MTRHQHSKDSIHVENYVQHLLQQSRRVYYMNSTKLYEIYFLQDVDLAGHQFILVHHSQLHRRRG